MVLSEISLPRSKNEKTNCYRLPVSFAMRIKKPNNIKKKKKKMLVVNRVKKPDSVDLSRAASVLTGVVFEFGFRTRKSVVYVE